MCGIFSFLFHLLHQKLFPNFCFLKFSWIKKSSQKLYFLQMYNDNNGRTIIWFLSNSWLKKPLGRKIFYQILVLRNVFKKGDFCQFLASKFYDKIWHCFNIFCNFVSQEILACLQWWQQHGIPQANGIAGQWAEVCIKCGRWWGLFEDHNREERSKNGGMVNKMMSWQQHGVPQAGRSGIPEVVLSISV